MNTLSYIRLIVGLLGAGIALPVIAGEQRERDSQRIPAAGKPDSGKVDINTADRKTLESIPVIGPDLAPAIIAARPFTTLNDLNRVQGISAERLEQIRIEVIVVPPHVTETSPGAAATRSPSPDAQPKEKEKVDLNTADVETLAAIPEIGPETAREIVAARPFTRFNELNRLSGMNAERLEQIRTRAMVVPPPAPEKKADRSRR